MPVINIIENAKYKFLFDNINQSQEGYSANLQYLYVKVKPLS